GGGVTTAFDNTVSTLTLPPGIQNLNGIALGVSSISWTWNPVPVAAQYHVYVAGVVIATVTPPSWIQPALSINVGSAIEVRVVNAAGQEGQPTDSSVVYTLSNPPTGTTVSTVYGSSVSLSWAAN